MGKSLTGKELPVGISQRSNGLFMARYVDRYKKRHTLYDRDLKKLKKRLEKAKYESEYMSFLAGEGYTLEEWFEKFLTLYKVNKVKDVTVYRIRQSFNPCKRYAVASMRLRDIKGLHIQQLINDLHSEGFSYGTLNNLKALLNEMFKKAIGNELLMMNPCDSVVLPKKEKYESRYLSEKEQSMFLEVAREYQYYDIFCANLACGMRIGELLGLQWDDIDFNNKTISIRRTLHYSRLSDDESCHFFFTTPKTETSERIIPLLPEMEKILNEVRKKQIKNQVVFRSKWKQEEMFKNMVFTTRHGKPVRYGEVNKSIKTIIVKVNAIEEELAKLENREPFFLKPFSPHCFRHTFVTRCRKNGLSFETITAYVGHSNREMTEYYDHNKPKMDIEHLNQVSFVGVV